jgi:predicted RNase H-like nuclease (RuvC/YqgF family)
VSKERYRLITEYPKDEFFDNKQVVKFDSYEGIRTLNQQADKIANLEAKLAESEKEIKEWIAVRDDKNNVINKQTEKINQLKQQLAEKEKEIQSLRTRDYITLLQMEMLELKVATQDQDKISFCIEQLNLLYKTLTTEDVWRAMKKGWWLNNGECLQLRQTIDNQIEELKKEMK